MCTLLLARKTIFFASGALFRKFEVAMVFMVCFMWWVASGGLWVLSRDSGDTACAKDFYSLFYSPHVGGVTGPKRPCRDLNVSKVAI